MQLMLLPAVLSLLLWQTSKAFRVITQQEIVSFEAACTANPTNANATYLYRDNDMRLAVCYLVHDTYKLFTNAHAACNVNQTGIGVGELVRNDLPTNTFVSTNILTLFTPTYKISWLSAHRLDTTNSDTQQGWFWYDNVTRPAVPIPPAYFGSYNPGTSHICLAQGALWTLQAIGACGSPSVAKYVCEYEIAPACGIASACGVAGPSAFRSAGNLHGYAGLNGILATHDNIQHKLKCLELCHSDCRCLAATYRYNAKKCALHYVTPDDDCFAVVKTDAIVYVIQ